MMGVTLGLGLGVTHRQSEWFNSGAYADLAAIADFNNNQYALPALGPELVVNGDFASDLSSWTANNSGTGTSTWVAGAMQLVGNGAGNLGYRQQLVATEVGKLYAVTFTQTGVQGFHYFGPTATAYVAGTQTIYFTATSASSVVGFGNSATVGTLTIDNVSVREVLLTRNAAALGANLAASGYTMSVNGGTGTATESPTGQLNLTGDGTNQATGDKSFTTVVGRRYRVVCTVGTNACGVSVGNTQGNNGIVNGAPAAVGFNSFEFTPTATTTWIRFFRTSASLSTITSIAVQELPAIGAYPKRAATFAEWLAFTAASDTARSYVDQSGTWRNSAYGVTNEYANSANFNSVSWGAYLLSVQYLSGNPVPGASQYVRITTSASPTNEGFFPTGPNRPAVAQGTPYSAQWLARYVDNDWQRFDLTDNTNASCQVWVNLRTGAIGGTSTGNAAFWSLPTATVSEVYPGWYLVTLNTVRTGVGVAAGTISTDCYPVTGNSTNIRPASKSFDLAYSARYPGNYVAPFIVTGSSGQYGGVNAPRLDFRNSKRQFRLEDARTNSIRNNSMSGAVAGSPGTAPTNWTASAQTGYAWQLAATGTEFGLPYIDYRLSGTDASLRANNIIFDTSTGIVAATGDTWSHSLFARVVAGSLTGVTTTLQMDENTSVGGFVANGNTTITTTSAITRYSFTRTLSGGATVARVQPFMRFTTGAGATVDLTIRIYAPQMELGAFASDPILTSGATAVTRAIETARFSPLLEAIMQRAAASVVVRGKLDVAGTSASDTRVVVGGNFCRIITSRTDATARSADAAAVLDVTPASGAFTTGFGAAYGTDSAGQSLDLNAGTVGSNTSPLTSANVRTAMYLGRDIAAGSYGHGLYDFVGISPERLSNATLQALAVPA